MPFDRNDPADLLALKTEITTDPTGIGYDLNGNTDAQVALANAKNPATPVSKPKISSALLRATCTFDAYNALSIDEQEWIRWMTGSNGFEEENIPVTTDLRTQLTGPGSASIWATAQRTEMNAAMLDLIDVPGSRMEVLFGFGTTINTTDWIAARDS